MTKIFVDLATRKKLNDLREPADLVDESGKILAHLTPAVDLTKWTPVDPGLSDEELERRRHEPDYSTVEVLCYILDRAAELH
jgi:hypothetical protein